MTPHRRSTDERFPMRCFRFVTAPLVDEHSGKPSITRCMAIFDTALAAYLAIVTHPLSGTVLGLLVMAMAAAFGKSTFGFFLTRYEMKSVVAESINNTRNDTHTVTENISRTIVERRDPEQGFEAAV